jgi:transcriptional regulator with XRE-family HTH domain
MPMMNQPPAADPRNASVRHMREVAAARMENTSLRQVAREIGMSPTGLKKFLEATAPYSPTVRRLRNWYVRYAAVQRSDVEEVDASAALEVLMHDLRSESRRDAALHVLEAVGTGYERSGRPRPDWLSELRTRYAAA